VNAIAHSNFENEAIEISFSDVAYSRGNRTLFSGLNFSIRSGEVLWVQGANGIGKTSILRLAARLARPNQGKINWQRNQKPESPNVLVAFQGHIDSFEPSFSPLESIEFWQDIYADDQDASSILEAVDLADQSFVKIRNLSAGQKRRLAFARLLVSQRPIWLLDEPKASIDSAGNDLIDHLIKTHVEKNGIAIIATHNLAGPVGKSARRLILEPVS